MVKKPFATAGRARRKRISYGAIYAAEMPIYQIDVGGSRRAFANGQHGFLQDHPARREAIIRVVC